MSFTVLVIAAIVLAAIFGTVWGGPLFAIPVLVIGFGVIGVIELRRRQREAQSMDAHRDEAKAEKVEFTARDQETLT